eukprot:CAMPEP_0172576922 /NCGR_PEP_ID=MMETSP1067-20121228/137966_1 /TAXON_ID=265564 ORGANISM="Thalassiosira punctigera, Strain Tpunct2005C2" /NCGR_SAMPLE_ID=MMETSP1067 /ASSEMBLY_ACC=CAM_ASM_000444 /LENGTH=763 /DNA_ID=CAMNT_0013369601 /DNA_START=10 /DNA_END=2301 /DNA_ORIENTATION=-
MTDTHSATPVEERLLINEDEGKTKKKKHKKKKRRHGINANTDFCAVDGEKAVDSPSIASAASTEEENENRKNTNVEQQQQQANEVEKEKKSKKKKNNKKEKKDRKRKRSSKGIDDDGHDSSCDNNGKKSKKKRKKSMKQRKDKRQQNSSQTQKEMAVDEKLISSSAIAYYPEELKHLQLKKNQEETATGTNNSTSNQEEESITEVADDGKNEKNYVNSSEGCPSVTKQNGKAYSGNSNNNITLLLFYQYVEPPWDESQFQTALRFVTDQGHLYGLTGRMRVAHEGLNCTLTGSRDGVRAWCSALRSFDGGRSRVYPSTGERRTEFADTEFKLTDDLPPRQRFPKLHAFEVVELVNYGLAGRRAPAISAHGGTHLEPEQYHEKMTEGDTVVIDVRNHYESNIGRFVPPPGGAKVIDPGMRKSTEFPMWLDRKETKEMLRGKQVLMYCTGGVRCERASALLKQKIDKEADTKELGIKGVYQLQGGVDKYFKQFPTGGLWKGKNYTFDKRFAHAPPAVEALERKKKVLGDKDDSGDDSGMLASSETASLTTQDGAGPANAAEEIMGKCEACHKPWDMYRGKRRCPTCGVPSLICRDCFEADRDGRKKLGRDIRCDLCVAEKVTNKRELREREEREMKEYERGLRCKLGQDQYDPPVQRKHAITRKPKPNPERTTRLFLKNMCSKQMDEGKLLEVLHPAKVTHIQWLTDRHTGKFYGSAFIEVKTAEDAGSVLALDGMVVLGRKIKVKYQQADEKDIWPIPNTEVSV